MMKKQSGAAMVEFAIIALVFFTVVFGLIESARLFFTLNTLTEMSRRGARLATVCPPDDAKITKALLFNNPTSGSTATSGILPFITSSNVRVLYLDKTGSAICNYDNTKFGQISYVAVQIIDYTHNFIFPPFNIPLGKNITDACNVTHRVFAETVLPREALGTVCNGTTDPNNPCTSVITNYCTTP